ncbi:hypothetical protein VPH35_050478 [Triticum aestivum]|uniref:Uncharacterized protein n=1 Tax=Triticum aestivum TaxID=4565 RepID=A0A077RQM2_WHEAT|nr:unnamed protein product [Triticum aestivum]
MEEGELSAGNMDGDSNITISLGYPGSANSVSYANGLVAPLEGGIPDLNELLGPIANGPAPEAHVPLVPQVIEPVQPALEEGLVNALININRPSVGHNMGLLPQQIVPHYSDISVDPMQLELLANANYQPTAPTLQANLVNQANPVAGSTSAQKTLCEDQNAAPKETDQVEGIPEDSNSGEHVPNMSAPPGFPIPAYLNEPHTIQLGGQHSKLQGTQIIQQSLLTEEEQHLGIEGARVWREPFAPSPNSNEVIQVLVDWANFLSAVLLTPGKFAWAKQFINSQVWEIITWGSTCLYTLPFAIPQSCSTENTLCTLSQQLHDKMEQEASSPLPTASTDSITASSTSALQKNRKRKDKAPLVETEVNEKDTTEEQPQTKNKKSKSSNPAKEHIRKTAASKDSSKAT